MLASQVVAKKAILMLAGKLSHMAGLVIYLKPFISPLWAVVADASKQPVLGSRSRTPRHLIH
eukprot:4592654-Amphidinium_carterae.1